MYYLRTKSAVDAIKFTLDTKKKEEPVAEVTEVVEVAQEVVEKQQEQAAKTAEKFAAKQQQKSVEVEPMSPEEMKALIAQAKEGQGDDCLMCGS